MNKSVSVLQIGARHHYLIPETFHKHGMLDHLYTDGYWSGSRFTHHISRNLPSFMDSLWRRVTLRNSPELPAEKVISANALGFAHALRRSRARSTSEATDIFCYYSGRLNEFALRNGICESDAIYAYNGAALETFYSAKRSGRACILDQTMGARSQMRKILSSDHEHFGQFQPSFVPPPEDDPRSAREIAEWQLADIILCPSKFVAETIVDSGGPSDKIRILPYGIGGSYKDGAVKNKTRHGRVNLLFVGSAGIRKGVFHLLESLQEISAIAHCKIVGPIEFDVQKVTVPENAEIVGPVSRNEVDDYYAWADLLVMPSLFEGSATVTLEALSRGLTVIATKNAGPPSVDGIIEIQARSPKAIANAVKLYASAPDEFRPSAQTYRQISHSRHEMELISIVEDLL